MSFENWTIEDLWSRCVDYDDMTLEMDKEEFAALRRLIGELKAKSEADGWIPVSERLPMDDETVITSNGVDIGKAWWDGEKWQCLTSHDSVPGGVTHWQPLPAPPKE